MRSPKNRLQILPRWTSAIALVIGVGAVLSGCSVATDAPVATPSVTVGAVATDLSVQDICDRAAELTAAGEPGEALALVGQYRGGIPTPIPTVTRRTSADTPAPTASPVVDCEPERLAALDYLGQSRLSDEVPAPAESFEKDWNALVASFFAPIVPVLLAGLLTLFVLLLLARAALALPRLPWIPQRDRRGRLFVLLGALAAMVLGTVLLVATLALGQLWLLVLFALVGAAGSLLLANHLAARTAASVEVHEAGSELRGASVALVAMIRQIGASPPDGVEVPIGTDTTVLANAVLTVPSTSAGARLVRWLFAPAPWNVLVSIESQRASVIVTRNRQVVASHVIDPELLFPRRTADPASATSAPPAVGSGERVVSAFPLLQPYLRECVAAAVVATFAEAYDNTDGLGGAGRWQSVALHYIATTAFAGDALTQRRLLAAALDSDPTNLLAEMSLQYLLRRHAGTAAEITPYLGWLESRIESVVQPAPDAGWMPSVAEVPVSAAADTGPEKVTPGDLDIARRLLMSYVASGLNLGQVEPSAVPDVELERNARRLIELLGDGRPPSGALRDRMRPVAGLMYVEVVGAEKGTGSPVDHWSRDALESPSPWVAFSVACYFSAGWSDSLSPGEKIVIERRIADRLRYALVEPALREAAMTDPVLARHRTHPWFIDLVHSFD